MLLEGLLAFAIVGLFLLVLYRIRTQQLQSRSMAQKAPPLDNIKLAIENYLVETATVPAIAPPPPTDQEKEKKLETHKELPPNTESHPVQTAKPNAQPIRQGVRWVAENRIQASKEPFIKIKLRKKSIFKFNPRDAIIYDEILRKKYE